MPSQQQENVSCSDAVKAPAWAAGKTKVLGAHGPCSRVPRPNPPLSCRQEKRCGLLITVQLRAVSNPMPTVKTKTRRRQYVVGETLADRVRALPGESPLPRGSWPIPVKYAR